MYIQEKNQKEFLNNNIIWISNNKKWIIKLEQWKNNKRIAITDNWYMDFPIIYHDNNISFNNPFKIPKYVSTSYINEGPDAGDWLLTTIGTAKLMEVHSNNSKV